MLISSPHIDNLNQVDDFIDLRERHSEDQARFLLEREQQMRVGKTIDQSVYLLRGDINEALNRMADLEEGLFDIDGTLTGIGDRTLYPRNIDSLHRVAQTNFTPTGITGRHYHQVRELWDNHPGGTAINHWMLEQGFYQTHTNGSADYFMGNDKLEQYVGQVRGFIEPMLEQIGRENNVRFIQTSADGYPHAHKSMYSIDAHHGDNNQKIGTMDNRLANDKRLHEHLLRLFAEKWHERDAANLVAKTGTSSIGTFEWTVDGISKARSITNHLNRKGIDSSRAAFFGDSGNDLSVFESASLDLLKVAIVNAHTKGSLIRHAHIATVGTGNAKPILDLLTKVRREA